MVSPLSRESTVGTLETGHIREIWDLIPFHVFLIFVSKYLLYEAC